MAKFTPTTAFEERLTESIASNTLTIPISSVKDRDGNLLPISATNKGYFTIEPGTSREESIVCDDIQESPPALIVATNGRGLAASGDSEVGSSGRAYSHNAGSKIIMTDIAQFFGNFVSYMEPSAEPTYSPVEDNDLTTRAWVENRNGYWEGAVANFAALPVGVNDGEARVTLDDGKIYTWDSTTSTWIIAGAGGGAGTVYITTKLGTEAEGDDNKTFELDSGSFPDKKYLQVYKNGVLMSEGATNDYIATGSNQAVFNDEVEDDDVITLLVVSVDLYNPDWNNVNDDVLPDVTETYDIGSTTKKFKDLHLSGDVSANSYSGDGTNLDDGANKLVSGTGANQLLRLDADEKIPAVDGSNLTNVGISKVGAATYDLSTASGVQNIAHGLGRVPKFVRIDGQIFAATSASTPPVRGFTVYDGTTQASISTYKMGNPGYETTANFRFSNAVSDGVNQTGVVTFDATNIIITWTKNGSPTGTLNLVWEAR
jgi:hypothetical protein